MEIISILLLIGLVCLCLQICRLCDRLEHLQTLLAKLFQQWATGDHVLITISGCSRCGTFSDSNNIVS